MHLCWTVIFSQFTKREDTTPPMDGCSNCSTHSITCSITCKNGHLLCCLLQPCPKPWAQPGSGTSSPPELLPACPGQQLCSQAPLGFGPCNLCQKRREVWGYKTLQGPPLLGGESSPLLWHCCFPTKIYLIFKADFLRSLCRHQQRSPAMPSSAEEPAGAAVWVSGEPSCLVNKGWTGVANPGSCGFSCCKVQAVLECAMGLIGRKRVCWCEACWF